MFKSPIVKYRSIKSCNGKGVGRNCIHQSTTVHIRLFDSVLARSVKMQINPKNSNQSDSINYIVMVIFENSCDKRRLNECDK